MNSVTRSIKHITVIFALLVCIICLPFMVQNAYAAEEIASGTCGDNLTWVLDDEGTLTITGEGEMNDYGVLYENGFSYGSPPWRLAASNASIEIKNIVIEPGVTKIGIGAFIESSITELHFPESVKRIEGLAFYQCPNLKKVYLPSSIEYLGRTYHNSVNPSTYYYGTIEDFLKIEKDMYNIGALYINDEIVERIVFPEGTTEIKKYELFGAESIKKVTIPDGVTSIGKSAFSYCTRMTKIELPEGITSIGENAFSCCYAIGNIALPPSVTSIGREAFSYCTSLRAANIPDGLTIINPSTFYNCKALTITHIPESLRMIGVSAFVQVKIPNLRLTDSNLLIQEKAFSECDIDKVYLPEGMNIINKKAFYKCSIDSIYLPNSISRIEDYAFAYTSFANEVIIPETVDYIGNNALGYSSVFLKCGTPSEQTSALVNCWSIKYICPKWTGNDRYNWAPDANWIPIHDYRDGIIIKEATCTEDGIESLECTGCYEIAEKTIPATGHSFSAWKTTKKATEIAAGKQTRTCSVCGKTETKTIAQLKPTLPAVKISKAVAGKKYATVKWYKVSAKNQKKIAKIQIQYSTDKSFKKNVKTVYAKKSATSKKITKLTSKKTYYFRIRAYKSSNGKVHVSKWSSTKYAKVK